MSLLDDLTFRFRSLRQRRRQEAELADELSFHLEMEIERRVADGMPRADAERAARLDFGGPEGVKEACRDAWGVRLLDDLARDLRGALRGLAKSPRFTAVAAGSLALGIGAVAVLFSLVDAVLLRPLPFGQPERVAALWEITPEGGRFSSSDPNLLSVRDTSQALDGLAAWSFPPPRPALERGGERIHLEGLAVTPSFFQVLGVTAREGRVFSPDDEGTPDAPPRAAVLSDAAWRTHFGADPQILGGEIDLDGEMHTVLGVLPADFRFGNSSPEIYLPFLLDPDYQRGNRRLSAIARLADDTTLDAAQAEADLIASRLADEFPSSNTDWGLELQPIESFFLGPDIRRTNLVLLGAAGLLLLLACVNVSNLLLARAGDRAAEIRLRLALGAGRPRIVAQLLTESLVLGLLGAAGGLALAFWTIPVIRGLDVPIPRIDEMTLDLRAAGLAVLVALTAGVLAGLLPALRSTSTAPGDSLRARAQGSTTEGNRLRAGLVATEVALATMLALAAGLLLRSFGELQNVEPGFDSEGVLLARIDLPMERYPEAANVTRAFFLDLVERVEAFPGVRAVGATTTSPFQGPNLSNRVGREDEADPEAFTRVQWRGLTAQAFNALGIPIVRGRSFDEKGKPRHEAVVSTQLATRLWPGRDPVGQRLRWIHPQGPMLYVVGVAAEVQDVELGADPTPMIYLSHRIMGWPSMVLVVRSDGPSAPLADALRATLHELDPLLAMPQISTLDSQRREALARPLLSLRLMAVASLLAVFLAAVGVYGIVAYSASRRRRELGVRLAMGAHPAQLTRLFVRDSSRLVVLGLVLGLLGAAAFAGTLRSLLYATSPFDPGVLAGVVATLALVGVLASLVPALRASRVDPATTLREE